MSILVTGGAGYIGSHTCVELLNAGHQVTVFDNFCNSHPEALARVERITGKTLGLVRGDVRDRAALTDALRASAATAVIHFAGLKAVGESVAKPLSLKRWASAASGPWFSARRRPSMATRSACR
jgi:UDP-glucose 4-epimerase